MLNTLLQVRFIGILVIFTLIPLIFFETSLSMIEIWMVNETFTHGFLIFPISIWLLIQRYPFLHAVPIKPKPAILLLIAGALLLWFLAEVADVQVVQQLAMIAIIQLLVWLAYGTTFFLKILFPILFLYFAVPIGQELIPPMMQFTAYFTVYLINLTGIPVYQDGLYFILPSGSWSVVEECSGVRYLIASIALGTIYAYVSYSSFTKRTIFILAAIIVPIVANGLRAFGIVMLGHASGMELATGVDHLVYGWIFFGIVIFIMFYIGSFWQDDRQDDPSSTRSSQNESSRPVRSAVVSVLAAAIVLILTTRTIANQVKLAPDTNLSGALIELPAAIGPWHKSDDSLTSWAPEFASPDLMVTQVYQFDNKSVKIDVGYYGYQRQGAEAVSSQNRLTDPLHGEWKITHSSGFELQGKTIQEAILRNGDQTIMVWKWYRIASSTTASSLQAKLLGIYEHLLFNRRDASMITLAIPVNSDENAVRETLTGFYRLAAAKIDSEIEQLTNAGNQPNN